MNTPTERDRESADDANWSTVETLVRDDIAAEVRCKNNYLAGHPPLYSVRVGRARVAENGSVWISPHISIYDLPIAEKLLLELGEKYRSLRSEQAGRKQVVEHKRSTRMSLSRDGELNLSPTQQPSRGAARPAYRDDEDD